MSIHFPPRHFAVPAGHLAGLILSDERTRVLSPVSLADGMDRDVIILDRKDWRDETPVAARTPDA